MPHINWFILTILLVPVAIVKAIGKEHFCPGFTQNREKILWASLISAEAEWDDAAVSAF